MLVVNVQQARIARIPTRLFDRPTCERVLDQVFRHPVLLSQRDELLPDRGSNLPAELMESACQPMDGGGGRFVPREGLMSKIQYQGELGRAVPQLVGVGRLFRSSGMFLHQ